MGKTLSAVIKYFNKLPCPRWILGRGLGSMVHYNLTKGPVLPQNALSYIFSQTQEKLAFIKEMRCSFFKMDVKWL